VSKTFLFLSHWEYVVICFDADTRIERRHLACKDAESEERKVDEERHSLVSELINILVLANCPVNWAGL
jgi:hypothetical protein